AGLDRAGPLVIWIDVPSSLGSTVAKVVLPRPGGPSKRMWPRGSLSFLQALRVMPSRCTTAFWPMTSRSQRGRRAASRSRCLSGSSGSGWTTAWRTMNTSLRLAVDFLQDVFDGVERAPGRQHPVEAVARLEGAVA